MSPISTEPACLNPAFLPPFALYESKSGEAAASVGWTLSPKPFTLSETQYQALTDLGPLLLRFLEALDTLYKHSVSETPVKGFQVPAWVRDYFHQGKPEALLQFSQMKRFRTQLPMVIRPDLLLTADGFALTEIDSVPGGLGFIGALNKAYRLSGFNVIEGTPGHDDDLPQLFLAALKAQMPEKENPEIAVVLSDEAQDYRLEWLWMISELQAIYPQIYLIHPKQMDLSKDKLVATLDNGNEVAMDLVYRFFELFDLPNIPKIELLQYAMKKRMVQVTPPFKAHLEEKMMMAFLHHPALRSFWEGQLGAESVVRLQALMPKTWIVDPSPLPPHAVIIGLEPAGAPIQSFLQLGSLSQKARQLVLKPSGFSPLAWGSRGVTIGHDVSGDEWQASIEKALSSFAETPYVLQEFHNPATQTFEKLELESGKSVEFQAKTRLCPYYLVKPNENGQPEVTLTGILATACPADKKIIHGMKDAVLAPCAVLPE